MRIWLINHYAVPIKYYPLARTTNFAKYLIRAGHEVRIFCASSVHNSDKNLIEDGTLCKEETVNGIPYVYVRCRSYQSKLQRVLNMLDFAWNLPQVCKYYDKPDVIMVSSQTPFACMRMLRIAKQMKAKSIIEVTDLWPESLVAYGIINRNNPILIPMYLFEKKMYECADDIIFSFEGGYDYIQEREWEKTIPKGKIHYINNGVDLEAFDYNKNRFTIEDKDLNNKEYFKVVYTGSIRFVNHLEKVIDVAKHVKNPKIKFLIWGKGNELSILKKRAVDEKIRNIIFKGYVDKKYIPYITSHADLNLQHGLGVLAKKFGTSNNKIFDYMAAGKPILTDFPCRYNPVVQCCAGIEVVNPALDTIVQGIEAFAEMDVETYERYCRNARNGAKKYDFEFLTNKLMEVMEAEIERNTSQKNN